MGKKNFENFPEAAKNIGCGIFILAVCFGSAFALLHDCFGIGR
jgi:hypothetical protein